MKLYQRPLSSWKSIPLLALLSCAAVLHKDLLYKESLHSNTIPDSLVVDTIGIIGTIVPARTEAPGHGDEGGDWTPLKSDVYEAEMIFRTNARREVRCIDTNYARFFRRYTGKGPGTTILIHGTRKSRDRYIGRYRSFWIDVGNGECSGFDALVNIRTGECSITVKDEE